MQVQKKYSNFLIELDVILDTRMGTIASYGHEALTKNVVPSYFVRQTDNFKLDDYKERYKNRDKTTLGNSVRTPFLENVVLPFIDDRNKSMLSGPEASVPRLIINTFPYVLTDEEINIIARSVAAVTQKLCEIQVVYWSYSDITPAMLKKEFVAMALYDYVEWIEVHSRGKEKLTSTCPDVALFGPEIVLEEFDPKDNIFRKIEDFTRIFIHLQLLPIEEFSMILVPIGD
jgi:hypothetical protein